MLATLAQTDPNIVLYGLLAGTHGGAAVAAVHGSHRLIVACYGLSAVLYGLFAAAHYMHF